MFHPCVIHILYKLIVNILYCEVVYIVFLCFLGIWASAKDLSPTDEQEYVTRYMARFFPRQHLSQLTLDDSLSERIWNNYLNALEYEHVFFLQSDINSFRKDFRNLDEAMKEGAQNDG